MEFRPLTVLVILVVLCGTRETGRDTAKPLKRRLVDALFQVCRRRTGLPRAGDSHRDHALVCARNPLLVKAAQKAISTSPKVCGLFAAFAQRNRSSPHVHRTRLWYI